MATVLLPVNGIGYGHLMRAALASRWLRRAGERPVIFFQGKFPASWPLATPGLSLLPFYRMPPTAAHQAAEQIVSHARLSSPSVIIEDTHLAPVSWPADIARLLLLRPTSFAYLRETRDLHGAGLASVLLCDHPDSPTWPYDAEQTAELQSWPGWECIGPIFRRPSTSALEDVRRRYRLQAATPLFVFSMGGGGEQLGSGDRPVFVEQAVAIAAQLRRLAPQARLVFVRGPLFSANVAIPEPFENVASEPELPSLLALADGAIIRPGFNVTWECIAGRTPFVTIAGTTFQEPVDDRLKRLRAHGLDPGSGVAAWFDAKWRRRFEQGCDAILAQHDGAPAAALVRAHDQCRQAATPPAAARQPPRAAGDPFAQLAGQVAEIPGAKHLLIRIDDIVERDEVLTWVTAICRDHGVPLSIEVIPYFARVTGAQLDALDPDGLCEVSQHGYAHLPGGLPGLRRNEFHDDRGQPSAATRAALRRGYRLLRWKFGERFKGGYSAPYDGWSDWLAPEWIAAGGRFISWMSGDPARSRVPNVKLALDPWDWSAHRARPTEAVAGQAEQDLRDDGAVGLVLHPQCLRDAGERLALEQLVAALMRGGCRGVPLSGAARVS